jgi:hypothetical protein
MGRLWRLSVVVIVLTLVAPMQAWGECAWVLWAQGFIEGTYPTGVVVEPWRPVGGWQAKGDCDTNKSATMKRGEEQQKTPEAKQTWKLVMGEYADTAKVIVEYVCLPDTVDPRGPKGSGR